MAEASRLNSSLIEELTDGLETDLQLSEYKVMKTSKGKDAILHDGYHPPARRDMGVIWFITKTTHFLNNFFFKVQT